MTEHALAGSRAQLHEAKLKLEQAEAPRELFRELFQDIVGMLARIDEAEAILRRKTDYYVRSPVSPLYPLPSSSSSRQRCRAKFVFCLSISMCVDVGFFLLARQVVLYYWHAKWRKCEVRMRRSSAVCRSRQVSAWGGQPEYLTLCV